MTFNLDAYLESKFSQVIRTRDDMHDYQDRIAVPFLLANPFSALFVDLGLGKTISVLTLIADLLNELSFERALVIGPKRVVTQTWPDEIPLWSHTAGLNAALIRDEEFQEAVRIAGRIARAPIVAEAREEAIKRGIDPDLDPSLVREVISEFVKLRGAEIKKARLRAARVEIRKACERNPASIHLVNREQVEQLVYAWGRDWPYDVVIIDESTSFSDYKTNRFKALKAVRKAGLIKRLHELTATPAADGYEQLFAQLYLLDEGKRLGKNITNYRNRYFIRGYDGYSWKLREGAEKEIAEKISDICLTLKGEDYLPLEKPVFNPRYVKLSSDELALYKKLEREFVLELDDGTVIEAETAGTLSGKLVQLASGFVYDSNKVTHQIHDHKIEELQQIVDEACGEPLLVVYWFKPSLDRIKKAFPKAVVMDPDGKCVKRWNEGKIPMLLVQPASAGDGLNLQRGGHHMVFFDIPWSLRLYLQVIGRLARQGQQHLVILHHIIAKGTIDEYVVECLRDKRDMQDALFRYLKAACRRMLNRCA
jgi:hypothetical protein